MRQISLVSVDKQLRIGYTVKTKALKNIISKALNTLNKFKCLTTIENTNIRETRYLEVSRVEP